MEFALGKEGFVAPRREFHTGFGRKMHFGMSSGPEQIRQQRHATCDLQL